MRMKGSLRRVSVCVCVCVCERMRMQESWGRRQARGLGGAGVYFRGGGRCGRPASLARLRGRSAPGLVKCTAKGRNKRQYVVRGPDSTTLCTRMTSRARCQGAPFPRHQGRGTGQCSLSPSTAQARNRHFAPHLGLRLGGCGYSACGTGRQAIVLSKFVGVKTGGGTRSRPPKVEEQVSED